MEREKFRIWREADRRAHDAEQRSRVLRKKIKGQYVPDTSAEKVARELREEADRHFEEAMQEMHGLVNAELNKPVRKPAG